MSTYWFSCVWKRFPGLFAASSFQGSKWGYLVCGSLDPSSCPYTTSPFPPTLSLMQNSNFNLTTVKCQVAAASQNSWDLSGQHNMWWACACWFSSLIYDTVPGSGTKRLKSQFSQLFGQRVPKLPPVFPGLRQSFRKDQQLKVWLRYSGGKGKEELSSAQARSSKVKNHDGVGYFKTHTHISSPHTLHAMTQSHTSVSSFMTNFPPCWILNLYFNLNLFCYIYGSLPNHMFFLAIIGIALAISATNVQTN